MESASGRPFRDDFEPFQCQNSANLALAVRIPTRIIAPITLARNFKPDNRKPYIAVAIVLIYNRDRLRAAQFHVGLHRVIDSAHAT